MVKKTSVWRKHERYVEQEEILFKIEGTQNIKKKFSGKNYTFKNKVVLGKKITLKLSLNI